MITTNEVEEFLLEKEGEESKFKNIVHLCLGGSHISKTNDETSDIDLRAIAIMDENDYIGLKPKFTNIKHVSGDGKINLFNDIDIEIFNFDNMIDRCNKGEVVTIETLMVPNSYILINNDIIKPLFENQELFYSKNIALNYCGTIKSHISKMTSTKNLKRSDKIERVQKYGFETKDGMKAVQYLELIIELLKTGRLNLERPNYKELLEIKQGKYNLEEIKTIIEELDREKESLLISSKLPLEPNFEKVNNFKKEFIKNVYKYLGIF